MTPGCHVVEFGAGTGVLSMLAARLGAGQVTALEVNRRSVDYARKAVQLNGLSDTVTVVEGHFADFCLSEGADILVCEMLSSIMLVEPQVPACRHGVSHVLRAGGTVLPASATVYLVPVECPGVLHRFAVEGLIFPPAPQTVDHGVARDLADLVPVVHFDFGDPDTPLHVEHRVQFEVADRGTVHGLLGMFDATLTDDIVLQMEDGWRELFLPLEAPVQVDRGDLLEVRVAYTPGEPASLELDARTK